jgi:hypothetical protein
MFLARLQSINEREIRVRCTIYFAMRTEKFFLTAVEIRGSRSLIMEGTSAELIVRNAPKNRVTVLVERLKNGYSYRCR